MTDGTASFIGLFGGANVSSPRDIGPLVIHGRADENTPA